MRLVIGTVLSFFVPGVADGLVGRTRAMLLWVAVAIAVIGVTAFSIWLVPLVFAVRIAAVTSAVRVLRDAQRAGTRSNVTGAVIAVGAIVVGSVAMRVVVTEAFKLPSSSMSPTLVVGDHILTNKLAPLRGIERGEVIVFNHPCSHSTFVERVIALGGDTVEVRCSVAYVNGAPLAAKLAQGEGCEYPDRMPDGAWQPRPCSEYVETAGARTYRLVFAPDRPTRGEVAGVHDFPRLGLPPEPPSCASAGDFGQAVTHQERGTIAGAPAASACAPQLHYVVPAGHLFTMGDSRDNSNDSRYWGALPVENVVGTVTGIWATDGPGGFSIARFGGVN